MMKVKYLFVLCCVCIFLISCGAPATEAPSPAVTTEPEPTDEPTNTETPVLGTPYCNTDPCVGLCGDTEISIVSPKYDGTKIFFEKRFLRIFDKDANVQPLIYDYIISDEECVQIIPSDPIQYKCCLITTGGEGRFTESKNTLEECNEKCDKDLYPDLVNLNQIAKV